MEKLKQIYKDVVENCETYGQAIQRFRSLESEGKITHDEYNTILEHYEEWLNEFDL